jgi:hypothetical protein
LQVHLPKTEKMPVKKRTIDIEWFKVTY